MLDAEAVASRDAGRLVGVVVTLGGQTPLKLSHAIHPGLVLGTPARRDRPRRGPRALELAVRLDRAAPAPGRHRHGPGGRPGRRARGRLPGARAAELRARRARHAARLRRRRAEALPDLHARVRRDRAGPSTARAASPRSDPSSSTGSWRTRSRSTSTPFATAPATCSSRASWSTSRRRACTRATRPARCRPRPSTPGSSPSSSPRRRRSPTPSASSVRATSSSP